jgi:hypothetical protein
MLITPRSIRLTRAANASVTSPEQAVLSQDELDAMWADTLAELVRSHRARLAATDPSRPWLTDEAPPTRGSALAAAPRSSRR